MKIRNVYIALVVILVIGGINTGIAQKVEKDIVNKYINAIGGSKELMKVNTLVTTGEMSFSGIKLDFIKKDMSPNLSLTIMTMNGEEVVKQLYNGKTATVTQMGKQQPMSEQEINEHSNMKNIFERMNYLNGVYKLEFKGDTLLEGKNAHKLKVTSPAGGVVLEYFDVITGLLVRQDKDIKIQDQLVHQAVTYTNYKTVGGLTLPFSNNITVTSPMGNQVRSLEIKDIKINEGVTQEDFQ